MARSRKKRGGDPLGPVGEPRGRAAAVARVLRPGGDLTIPEDWVPDFPFGGGADARARVMWRFRRGFEGITFESSVGLFQFRRSVPLSGGLASGFAALVMVVLLAL